MDDISIPGGATKYILFQRTGLMYVRNISFISLLLKFLPSFVNNAIARLEAVFRRKKMQALYQI
jgi:hypothetical protein